MSRPPHRPSRHDETLARADMALRMGQLYEAEQIAASVLKADKNHLIAATILGHALLAQGRHDDAIPVIERAARRHPDPAVQTLLASALAAAGRRDDALVQLEAITGKGVVFPQAYREHANQLAALDRITDAIDVAARGAALCPEAVELSLILASLHLRRNDRPAARSVLLEARDASPGRADVLAEMARVMILDGDYAEAADTCRHALALQPDNAMTRANLAACQLELGQREAGEASLRAATQGRPQMVGRAIHALAASSHGRFFIKPSDVVKFLRNEKR